MGAMDLLRSGNACPPSVRGVAQRASSHHDACGGPIYGLAVGWAKSSTWALAH